nr:hypothetical protein [Allomuricauda sp.]
MTDISIFGLHLFTVLGALFILIGTLLIHSGNQLKNKSKIETLEGKIGTLTEDNQILSEKLTKTSLELNKSVMGDGFAIFGLVGRTEKSKYYGTLQSISDYNIYDLSLLVTDADKIRKCKTKNVNGKFIIDHDCFYENTKADKIPGIPTRSSHFPNYNLTTSEKRKHLEIKITTRNNRTVQHAVFEMTPSYCKQSYRLYQFNGKRWKLVDENNQLGLSNEYWSDHFYPMDNRKIDIL